MTATPQRILLFVGRFGSAAIGSLGGAAIYAWKYYDPSPLHDVLPYASGLSRAYIFTFVGASAGLISTSMWINICCECVCRLFRPPKDATEAAKFYVAIIVPLAATMMFVLATISLYGSYTVEVKWSGGDAPLYWGSILAFAAVSAAIASFEKKLLRDSFASRS